MSVKHPGPGRRPWKKTVGASLWLFVLVAGPSTASHYLETDCDPATSAVDSNRQQDLTAVVVAGYDPDSRGDAAILAGLQTDAPAGLTVMPGRADETAVLAHDESPSALAESSVDSSDGFAPDPQEIDGLDASIPGMSDEELQRFRREMYRKDI